MTDCGLSTPAWTVAVARAHELRITILYCSKGPCEVFDSWVRWKRGQVGIREFVRRHLEIWESGNLRIRKPGNLGIWESGDLGIWKSGNLESNKNKMETVRMKICYAQNVGRVLISKKNPYALQPFLTFSMR